jgi:hypothetical protein
MTATSSPLHFPVKLAGLITGLVIAAGLIAFLRIPASDGTLGADVRLVATTSGGLKSSASGPFLSGRHLESGGAAATGKLTLTNNSAGEALVSFRALAPRDRTSRIVHVELSYDGRKIVSGSLADLRDWDGALRIPRGSGRTVDASAWIPGSVRDGYEGSTADITFQARPKAVRR